MPLRSFHGPERMSVLIRGKANIQREYLLAFLWPPTDIKLAPFTCNAYQAGDGGRPPWPSGGGSSFPSPVGETSGHAERSPGRAKSKHVPGRPQTRLDAEPTPTLWVTPPRRGFFSALRLGGRLISPEVKRQISQLGIRSSVVLVAADR